MNKDQNNFSINKFIENPYLLKDFKKICEIIINELKKVIKFNGIFILLIDETLENLEIIKADFHNEIEMMVEVVEGTKISVLSDYSYSQAMKTKKTVYLNELDKKHSKLEQKSIFEVLKMSSSLSIPLIEDNFSIGVVFFYSINYDIDKEEIKDAEKVINNNLDFLLLAKDYNRLLKKESDTAGVLDKNKKIIELAERINSVDTLDTIYNTVPEEMLNIFNFDLSYLFLKEGNFCKLINVKYSDKEKFEKTAEKITNYYHTHDGGYRIDPPEGATVLALLRKTHFYFEDVTPALNYQMSTKDKDVLNIAQTPKTVFMTAIIHKGEAIGVIHLWTVDKIVKLNQGDISIINSLCAFIGTAIENSKLYTQLEEQRKVILNSKNEIEKINEITKQISLSLDYSSVFDKVSNYLLQTYGFEGCILYIIDGEMKSIIVDKYKLPDSIKNLNLQNDHNNFPLRKNSGNISDCIFNNKTYYFPVIDENTFTIPIDKYVSKTLKLKSLLNIPIYIGEQIVGLFSLTSHTKNIQIKENDIQAIKRFVNQISIILKNSRLYQEINTTKNMLEEKDRIMTEDLIMAKQIQTSIISDSSNDDDNINYSIFFSPMIEVGGDIYDIFQLKPGYHRIFIADATGHGVQAALITMIIKLEYDKIKTFEINPNMILQLLNNVFLESYSNIHFMFSCAILDIDINNSKIYFSSAGHPDCFIRQNGKVNTLRSKGKIIGVTKELDCEVLIKDISNEDFILIFTDGITESLNEDNIEYGEESIINFISNNHELSVKNFLTNLVNELNNFRGNAQIQDDTTIIAIDFK